MKLFISYSRDDKAWVYDLAYNLHNSTPHNVWLDRRLVAASDWWNDILDNIQTCDCFIYIMSPKAVGSIFCQAEVAYALALNKPVLPLMLKPAPYPNVLSKRQIQYETITNATNIDNVLLRIMFGLQKVETDVQKGKYQPQEVIRPEVPQPAANPEQLFEVFAAAEEAASEGNLSLAEQLFAQINQVAPDGMGKAAMKRLNDIKHEYNRYLAYQQVLKLADNPNTFKGAQALWEFYNEQYESDYDPENLSKRLGKSIANTVVAIPEPSSAKATTNIEPTEDEVQPDESPYAHLTVYLDNRMSAEDRVKLSFKEIEQIIERELPASAYKHRPWWANDTLSDAQARSWLDAGWRVGDISLTERTVNFVRTNERGQQYIAFFSALIKELEEKSEIPFRIMSPSGVNWHSIGSVRDKNYHEVGIFAFTFTRKRTFGIEFYIDSGNKERNKTIFDDLVSDLSIASFINELRKLNAISGPLSNISIRDSFSFERLDDRRASRVAVYLPGTITNSEESLAELRSLAVKMMIALITTVLVSLYHSGEKYTFEG